MKKKLQWANRYSAEADKYILNAYIFYNDAQVYGAEGRFRLWEDYENSGLSVATYTEYGEHFEFGKMLYVQMLSAPVKTLKFYCQLLANKRIGDMRDKTILTQPINGRIRGAQRIAVTERVKNGKVRGWDRLYLPICKLADYPTLV